MIGRIIPIFHAQFPLPATSHSSRSRVKGTVSDNRSYPTGRVTRSLETFVQLSAANNSWKCWPRWACISPRSKKKTKQRKKKGTSAKGNTSFSQSMLQRESIRPREYLYKTGGYRIRRAVVNIYRTRDEIFHDLLLPRFREGRGYTKREARDKGIRSFPVIWNRSLFEIPSGF